jgi:nitroreductase
MMLRDLILKNRSYRRFFEEMPVSMQTLRELVDLARLSASGANMQPLKYLLSCDPRTNALVFAHLAWAGYLKTWPGPAEGERPSAYIILLGDKRITQSFGCDHGIAAQSILLGATEKGLGGCMIGSVQRRELSQVLAVPADLEILLVIALGKPKETVVLRAAEAGGDIRYWRDERGVHHVPKRSLIEIILEPSHARLAGGTNESQGAS